MAVATNKKAGLKRKLHAKKEAPSVKKRKIQIDSVDKLAWKKVSRPKVSGFEGDDGIIELEEIDGVDVVFEEKETGRVARFEVNEREENEIVNGDSAETDEDITGEENIEGDVEEEETFDVDNMLPEWKQFPLHPQLFSSLYKQKFTKPTPIQESTLPVAIKGKDVVGIAQTGSGKTLGYGLPILNKILSSPRPSGKRKLRALILTPTRELALQVSDHLSACIIDGKKKIDKSLPRVSIAAVVGGMSVQKQRRILDRGVEVLIATPGRLWDILEDDDNLANQIKKLQFLVLDEADRMIENGHFAELDNILRLTSRQFNQETTDAEFSNDKEDQTATPASDDESPLQTFIFSATLSKDLQQNLKLRRTRERKVTKKGSQVKPSSTLDELLLRLDFRDPEPEVIDLSPKGGVVSTLKECKVECLNGDKDVYLYYFLLRYPGRTLVFLSSVDGIRRLLPICELLQLNAYPLHSHLQQRQRLKNLDRFKLAENAVLLATDVAARGLDIPSVDHVIHYQIPRTADSYIHRNGRTARASRDGLSLILCAPDERRVVHALLTSLDRVGENEIPDIAFELDLLDKLKSRVQLARRIDLSQHTQKKEKHEKNWLKEAAEALEVDLDSDLDDHHLSDEESTARKRQTQKQQTNLQSLKAELKHLLDQPIVAQGIMKKYITSGARHVVSQLLEDEGTEDMLGFTKGQAKDHLTSIPTNSSNKPKNAPNTKHNKNSKNGKKGREADAEEWTGFTNDE